MTRDNRHRLRIFTERDITVRRLALNMDQVEEYDPPPNPTKFSDSRAEGYVAAFGDSSWELDAPEPRVIEQLIRSAVENLIDPEPWDRQLERQEAGRERLREVANSF